MPSMRKHTNDGSFAVDVRQGPGVVGPMPCPQPGCDGGNVHFEIYGGYSGDYMTSAPCHCCDGKGQLYGGEKAYKSLCLAAGVRDVRTGYPHPIPMSVDVYNDADVIRAAREKKTDEYKPQPYKGKSDCFIATAVYGDINAVEVREFREFRDLRLSTSFAGRIFISFYYKISPTLAKFIYNKRTIKSLSKLVLEFIRNRVINKTS